MRKLQQRLQKAVAENQIPGAAVVVTNAQETIWRESFGAYRLDTIFFIASSSKPLAATTIFLSGHLSESQQRLLAHSAGVFGNGTKDPVERDLLRNAGRSLADAAAGIADRPLIYPPGSGTVYSDAGFLLAGRAAEVATGREFDAVMRDVLLDPLGMRDTFYRLSSERSAEIVPRVAVSYQHTEGKLQRAVLQHRLKQADVNQESLIRVGSGLFSTADDLAAFLRLHLSSGDRFAEMHRDHTNGRWHKDPMGGVNDGYGLGWQLGAEAFFHAGAFGSFLWAHPRLNLGIVLLTQMPIMQVYPLWREITGYLNPT